jgi:hypothetical protein
MSRSMTRRRHHHDGPVAENVEIFVVQDLGPAFLSAA